LAADLAKLSQEYSLDRTSSKYSLAQLQEILSRFANLDWQLSGSKSEQNTSLKPLTNKMLAQMTSVNQNLKALQQEVTAGNERLSEAVSKGFHELSVALTGVNNPPVSATPLTPVGGSTAAPKLSCFPFLFFHKVSPRRRIVLSQRCSLLGFRSSWLQRALWNLWDLSSDLRHTSELPISEREERTALT